MTPGGSCASPRSRFDRHPRESRRDARGRFDRSEQASRDLGAAAAATMIVDGNLQDAQARGRGAHLHLDVPAIGPLAHSKPEQHLASNRTQGRHIGVAHAIKETNGQTGESAGGELMPGDTAGGTLSTRTRADDKIPLAAEDRFYKLG